jgi:hypothetical protein
MNGTLIFTTINVMQPLEAIDTLKVEAIFAAGIGLLYYLFLAIKLSPVNYASYLHRTDLLKAETASRRLQLICYFISADTRSRLNEVCQFLY